MLLDRSELRAFEQELAPSSAAAPVAVASAQGRVEFRVGRHGTDLEGLLPSLDADTHYYIPTRGAFSLSDMLLFLLHRCGPSRVWLATWGISARPLQLVLDAARDGRITQLHMVMDPRVQSECPEAFQQLHTPPANVRFALRKNHSKVIVLLNDAHAVVVNASANLTDNPRQESYVIGTHRPLADFTSSWLDRLLDGENPFEHER